MRRIGRIGLLMVAVFITGSSGALALLLADGREEVPVIVAGPSTSSTAGVTTTSSSRAPDRPDWSRCENKMYNYSVSYPRSWKKGQLGECDLFDRDDIVEVPRSEPPRVDVQIFEYEGFDRAVVELRASGDFALLSLTDTTVAGFPALRFEARAGRHVFAVAEGELAYGYLVNHRGRAFRIVTYTGFPGHPAPYEENKAILDAMAQSLELR